MVSKAKGALGEILVNIRKAAGDVKIFELAATSRVAESTLQKAESTGRVKLKTLRHAYVDSLGLSDPDDPNYRKDLPQLWTRIALEWLMLQDGAELMLNDRRAVSQALRTVKGAHHKEIDEVGEQAGEALSQLSPQAREVFLRALHSASAEQLSRLLETAMSMTPKEAA